jgi:hypothetical protein
VGTVRRTEGDGRFGPAQRPVVIHEAAESSPRPRRGQGSFGRFEPSFGSAVVNRRPNALRAIGADVTIASWC